MVDRNNTLSPGRRIPPWWAVALAVIMAQPIPSAWPGNSTLQAPAADQPVRANSVTEVATVRNAESWILFLTIVGDRTYLHWGHPGDRPPRVDTLAATDPQQLRSNTQEAGTIEPPPAPAPEPVLAMEPTYGGEAGQRPFGPAPQECPRTLPPGSTQATADALQSQAGCRYLSSCSAKGDCSWHYQGRMIPSGG